MTWYIRDGGTEDAEICHRVYVDAVRNGTAPHYSRAEALAWAPSGETGAWMAQRLAVGTSWVAERDARAQGFLTVTPDGHLDLFFVRPEWRRSGMADALYQAMMGWAGQRGITRMTTDASHLARAFLERRGWQALELERNLRNGVELHRWKMAWQQPANAADSDGG